MKLDFENTWAHENNFYLTCDPSRIGKFVAHLELYKRIIELPGCVAEFGVFKGASFSRLCIFRELLESAATCQIIGFDTFQSFPETNYQDDQKKRK